MNNFIIYFRSFIAYILLTLLQIFFQKAKSNSNNILFIHTAGFGDLIYSSKIINTLEHDDRNEYYFLFKSDHKDLYVEYGGKIRILFIDYEKYRKNIFYRIKFIKILRDKGFDKVFILNQNRRIIDDDLALNIGAKETFAFEGVHKSFPKVFKKHVDKMYDAILLDKYKYIEEKINYLLQNILKVKEISCHKIYIKNGLLTKERYSFQNIQKNLVVIQPFASNGIKNLSPRKIKKLIEILVAKLNCIIIILGERRHYLVIENEIKGYKNIYNLAGEITFQESILLVKDSDLFIGVDSSMSHVAIYYDVLRIIFVGGGAYGLMYRKEAYHNNNQREKMLFSQMECFGCNWYCKYDTPKCLTDINEQKIASTIDEILNLINKTNHITNYNN